MPFAVCSVVDNVGISSIKVGKSSQERRTGRRFPCGPLSSRTRVHQIFDGDNITKKNYNKRIWQMPLSCDLPTLPVIHIRRPICLSCDSPDPPPLKIFRPPWGGGLADFSTGVGRTDFSVENKGIMNKLRNGLWHFGSQYGWAPPP